MMAIRHSQRTLILDDAADAERALVARLELLSLLGQDPHIQAAIRRWLRSANGRRCMEAIRAAPTGIEAAATWATNRAAVGAIVTAPLKLEPCDWLCRWLADLACVMAMQGQAEWRSVHFTFCATGTPGYAGPRRRSAKGGGASLARDVGWYYRAALKIPRDSIKSLAREYAAAESRHTDARAVIQDGIKRARTLLGLRAAPRQ